MLPRLWLLVGSDQQTDRPTMSLIELSWTAKKELVSQLLWLDFIIITLTFHKKEICFQIEKLKRSCSCKFSPVDFADVQVALQPVLVLYRKNRKNRRWTTLVRLLIGGGRSEPLLAGSRIVPSLSWISNLSYHHSVWKAVNSRTTTIPPFAVIVSVWVNLCGYWQG